MKYLVTGTSGHLGDALVQTLKAQHHEVIGLDINPGASTSHIGDISNKAFVDQHMHGVDVVFHPATLHKPHAVTHTKREFIDTNVSGTLNLLETAVEHKVGAFIFTSTTSTYGHALRPEASLPAAWVTEETVPIPKNIYGITKLAAENLCKLFHDKDDLPIIILRTSRFFPEEDDNALIREKFPDGNVKMNEYLYRRVELEDVVSAHLLAATKAAGIGFGKYIITASSPFQTSDLEELRTNPAAVVARYHPDYSAIFNKLGWHMFDDIERVYVNHKARAELGWRPKHDFGSMLDLLSRGDDLRSSISQTIGIKGYHDETFDDGPFPVE